jgi:hypothetical protein
MPDESANTLQREEYKMGELPPQVEQQLYEMSDGDFRALVARTRGAPVEEVVDPKTIAAEALRRHIASTTVDAFIEVEGHGQGGQPL